MTALERAPVLRVMPGPADINANGHIFGGWVLSQMDIAAGIVASRRARGPVATVAIEVDAQAVRMAVMGVRNSWLASAVKRLCASCASSIGFSVRRARK